MPAKYSYTWANRVIKQLREKYARALTLSEELLDIDDQVLAKYLARGDQVYVDVRNLTHFLDNHGRLLEELYTREGVFSQVIKYWHCKSGERILARLDTVEKQRRIKEQAMRGGGGGSEATEPAFLRSSDSGGADGLQQIVCKGPVGDKNEGQDAEKSHGQGHRSPPC